MADLSVFTKHLGSLTDDELNELLSRLEIEKSRRDQPEDTKGLTVKDGNIVACSHCGSVEFKKHGKKDGHQDTVAKIAVKHLWKHQIPCSIGRNYRQSNGKS